MEGGEIVTAAEMREIEAQAISSGAVSGLALMERAGEGVVEAVLRAWPAAGPGRALVACGPGNNGGDGFVVARLLRARGWRVEVLLLGEAAALPPDARVNHDRWASQGRVGDLFGPLPEAGADLLVDALFGIGLTRPLAPALLARFHDLRGLCRYAVAIDVPSGLCSDSGRVLGGAELPAFDLCVTFHRPKPGHFLGSPDLGRLVCVDIGLEAPPSTLRLVGAPRRGLGKGQGHKFSHGHAVVLSGPSGAGGAARLAARSALRVGAGLVTLACPPEALSENAARLDAVMLKPLEGPAALGALLADPRIGALCLGPGLGLDPRGAALVGVALEASRAATRAGTPQALRLVLDADALTHIARDPALFAMVHEGCVLTPHGGEFARLFPDLADRLSALATQGPAWSRLDATRAASTRARCTVLLKGPDTVIASPGGAPALHAALYDRAAPWLATAGSGDVLAGLITGLLARGFLPQEAAETAAWLHVEAARAFGPGLIAEDLPETLPAVFRALSL